MVHISNQDADTLVALLNVTMPEGLSLKEQNVVRRVRLALKRLKKKRSSCLR